MNAVSLSRFELNKRRYLEQSISITMHYSSSENLVHRSWKSCDDDWCFLLHVASALVMRMLDVGLDASEISVT
jgi:hypothetical protein